MTSFPVREVEKRNVEQGNGGRYLGSVRESVTSSTGVHHESTPRVRHVSSMQQGYVTIVDDAHGICRRAGNLAPGVRPRSCLLPALRARFPT